MFLSSFSEFLDTLEITLVAVKIIVLTEDKLYLSHKNSQKKKEKLIAALVVILSWKVYMKA